MVCRLRVTFGARNMRTERHVPARLGEHGLFGAAGLQLSVEPFGAISITGRDEAVHGA